MAAVARAAAMACRDYEYGFSTKRGHAHASVVYCVLVCRPTPEAAIAGSIPRFFRFFRFLRFLRFLRFFRFDLVKPAVQAGGSFCDGIDNVAMTVGFAIFTLLVEHEDEAPML